MLGSTAFSAKGVSAASKKSSKLRPDPGLSFESFSTRDWLVTAAVQNLLASASGYERADTFHMQGLGSRSRAVQNRACDAQILSERFKHFFKLGPIRLTHLTSSTNTTDSVSDPSAATKLPAAVSGKRMTVVVLLTLLITGGLFYWVTLAYSAYNAARRETDRTWRELAPELSLRYRDLDRSIAEANDAREIDPQSLYKWAAARDAFSGTSQSLGQIEAAQTLEQLVASMPARVRGSQRPSPELERLAANYSSAATNQRAVGHRAGSRLLKTMLNLPDPPEFQITE